MSTDSSELTFVRCPSCRSLVPALSTRCRMCGATLDAAAGATPAKGEDGSSRVRQRTISHSKSELTETAKEIRGAAGNEGDTEVRSASGTPHEGSSAAGDEFDDPLSGYIEEVEAEVAKPEKAAPEQSPREPSKAAESVSEADDDAPPAKVIVESGGRRGGRGGLSFGRPQEREGTESGAREERREKEKPRDSGAHRRDRERDRDRERERERSGARPDSSGREVKPEREQPAPRERERSPEPAAQRPAERSVETGSVRGRLLGWLVSYSTPEGEASELREGKFFVSGSRLKPTDMVIDDSSISTPHALVSVSATRGMVIQDLMSDRGIFVRSKAADTYRREEELLEAQHGEWVRFGDVEFLVCLIAHAGVK